MNSLMAAATGEVVEGSKGGEDDH
eukprot:COSAG02_NODE_68136_length_251_cov_0.684211_1_plen_23_part_10